MPMIASVVRLFLASTFQNCDMLMMCLPSICMCVCVSAIFFYLFCIFVVDTVSIRIQIKVYTGTVYEAFFFIENQPIDGSAIFFCFSKRGRKNMLLKTYK